MSQPLAPGDLYRCIVGCYNTQSQNSLNRFDYRIVSSSTGAQDTDLAAAVDVQAATAFKLMMTNNATYYGVKCVRISPRQSTAPIVINASQGVASGGTSPMSTQTCGIIRKLPKGYGRGREGRIFMPFPDQSGSTGGLPNATYVTELNTLASHLISSVIFVAPSGLLVTVVPVINARLVGPGPVFTPTWTDCAGTVAEAKWATQRSRGSFGRLNPTPPF